jgi:hypothetical protein
MIIKLKVEEPKIVFDPAFKEIRDIILRCFSEKKTRILDQTNNKGNAKRGVSPRLKIRPCDLDF